MYLAGQDVKAAIINMFKELKKTMFLKLKEYMTTKQSIHRESNKENKSIKKTKCKFWRQKVQ